MDLKYRKNNNISWKKRLKGAPWKVSLTALPHGLKTTGPINLYSHLLARLIKNNLLYCILEPYLPNAIKMCF